MKNLLQPIIIIALIITLSCGCANLNLPSNCNTNKDVTIAVLPFRNDNYQCHHNIEKKLENLCYKIINGEQLLNQYSITTNKTFGQISTTEFIDFAKQQGVNKVLYGEINIV